jgi:hypothetical protein
VGVGVGGVVLDGEELDAVAGGEDECFADAGLVGEGAVVWLTPRRRSFELAVSWLMGP